MGVTIVMDTLTMRVIIITDPIILCEVINSTKPRALTTFQQTLVLILIIEKEIIRHLIWL